MIVWIDHSLFPVPFLLKRFEVGVLVSGPENPKHSAEASAGEITGYGNDDDGERERHYMAQAVV